MGVDVDVDVDADIVFLPRKGLTRGIDADSDRMPILHVKPLYLRQLGDIMQMPL